MSSYLITKPIDLILAEVGETGEHTLKRALGPVHRVWMIIGHLLGWINTRIILGILFYLIVTPVGMVLRFRGKDPMQRRFDPRATTYRLPRQERPPSHMKHQF